MNAKANYTQISTADFADMRRAMVTSQICDRGIRSLGVLAAMEAVPRHLFVRREYVADAYADEALPIESGQTISQPFMVAAMAEALSLKGNERVLEVGAGSGYQAAVLSLLAREVVAVEVIPALASSARERLTRLGYRNVTIEEGDGSDGWFAAAPFDAIVVSAASPGIPLPLTDQLAENGRLLIPVGAVDHQELIRVVRRDGRLSQQPLHACRFVPLVGRHGWRRNIQETSLG